MWTPQNIHQTHTPHLENKCRHRHTGIHRYIHSQRQSENLGDISIFLSKWEALELMNYGQRRKNRKVCRTKPQERDWKAGTTKDNKVADDGRNPISFLLTIFLAGSNFSEPHWERQEGATSHHLSQEPCGWQEAVLSCPGHVSHVREEPKTRIKGLRNRASPSSSLLRCWQTLCCLDTVSAHWEPEQGFHRGCSDQRGGQGAGPWGWQGWGCIPRGSKNLETWWRMSCEAGGGICCLCSEL